MINSFCGMTDWQKAFSLISSQDHCQRSSLLWISDMPWARKIWTCAEPAEFRLCRMKLQPTFATNFIQMLSKLVLTCFFVCKLVECPYLLKVIIVTNNNRNTTTTQHYRLSSSCKAGLKCSQQPEPYWNVPRVLANNGRKFIPQELVFSQQLFKEVLGKEPE